MSKRNGAAKGLKPNRNRNKPVRQVKKMRKSSLSKAQKNFSVFQHASHENKYETLHAIRNYAEEGDDEVLILHDNDGTELALNDIDEVSVSEPELSGGSDEDVNSNGAYVNGNSLDANDDFIAFDLSDGDDEEDEEEEEEQEGEDMLEENQDAAAESVPNGVRRMHNPEFPWISNHDHSKQRELADWLTLEIKDFVAYISPNRAEIEQRNGAIKKLKAAVKELWPDSNLNCFGSYATDLYLPGSDIDCVVRSANGDKENRNSLYALASFLKRKQLATQVEVIAKARVPIIKFVEPESRIHIDVSFERINGLEAARVIRGWLDEQQGLRELVLIVKQFLHARRLNDVHTGGLGGYSIICLVYSFLKLHPRIVTGDIDPMENLGVLLIDFFELYGKNFGYDDVGISVGEHEARYIPKSEHPDLTAGRPRFSLLIQDPGDASNNISRGSFNLRDIKKGFAGAFDLLTNRCFELDKATFKDRIGSSILGNVIKYKGVKRDFNDERSLVINHAIQENEKYHNKRGRIVHDELFTEMSDLEAEDEIYDIEAPSKKKRKKDKGKDKDKDKKEMSKERKEKKERKREKREKRREKKEKLKNANLSGAQPDSLEEEDDYDPTKAILIHSHSSDNEDDYDPTKPSVDDYMGINGSDSEHPDNEFPKQSVPVTEDKSTDLVRIKSQEDLDSDPKAQLVDKQTKRDYWLSKGQAM